MVLFFLRTLTQDHPPRNLRLPRPASEELVIMESPPAVKHMDLGDPALGWPADLGHTPWPFKKSSWTIAEGCPTVDVVWSKQLGLTRSEFSHIFPRSKVPRRRRVMGNKPHMLETGTPKQGSPVELECHLNPESEKPVGGLSTFLLAGIYFQQQILTNDLFFRGNQRENFETYPISDAFSDSLINIHHHCSKMRQKSKCTIISQYNNITLYIYM